MLRRTFLKTLAIGTAGLFLPADAAEAITDPPRRLWRLDRTQIQRPQIHPVNYSVTFSEALDPASVTPNTVRLLNHRGEPLAAIVTYDTASGMVTLDPVGPLYNGEQYIVSVGYGIMDIAGNLL